ARGPAGRPLRGGDGAPAAGAAAGSGLEVREAPGAAADGVGGRPGGEGADLHLLRRDVAVSGGGADGAGVPGAADRRGRAVGREEPRGGRAGPGDATVPGGGGGPGARFDGGGQRGAGLPVLLPPGQLRPALEPDGGGAADRPDRPVRTGEGQGSHLE